ncbi:MAG: DUF3473 domain-containing protein [Gammaproteobacteria bacterium]|nr:DUF3473 domain-containing protein [Gammaproteobacteria bacterium]
MMTTAVQKKISNAMTIDVEDYFQVSAFAANVDYANWGDYESRVVKNTHVILRAMSDAQRQGTFFVLGWVAEREPQLVKDILSEGHEVACHGYSHQLIYNQTPEIFYQETRKAKEILEDIIQKPVEGYRAASYSITKESMWAMDILGDLGFTYDSSIFPVYHDRYGVPDAPKHPYQHTLSNGSSIVEFPISTKKLLGYQLPVAGGGYFRVYPYPFSRSMLASINKKENKPFVFYLHPWEVDPEQPRIKTSLLSRTRHYMNLNRCETRFRALLQDFEFTTMANVLSGLGFDSVGDR